VIVAATGFTASKAVWDAMRASGVVSLVLLTVVMILGIATVQRWRPHGQPRFVTPALHRSLALLATVFLGLHVLTAVADPYARVGVAAVLVPFASAWRPFWVGLGTVAIDLGAALVVTSLVRDRLTPRAWRGVHWLAYLAWPLALGHSLGSGTDAKTAWMAMLAGVSIAAVLAAAGWRLLLVGRGKHLEPQRTTA
jgi:sulfoxide reductase heme-binding subunit YedZ